MLTRRRKTKTETQIHTKPTKETYTLLMVTKMGAQVPIGRNGLFHVFDDWMEAGCAIAHAVNVQMPIQLIETIIVTVTQTRAGQLLVLNTARLDHGEIAAICDGKADIPNVVGRNLRVIVPAAKGART